MSRTVKLLRRDAAGTIAVNCPDWVLKRELRIADLNNTGVSEGLYIVE
jgi:hypothetical protein